MRDARTVGIYGSCVSRDATDYLGSDWTLAAYHARQSAAVLALPYQRPDLDLSALSSRFQQRVVMGDHLRSAVWELPRLAVDVVLWDLVDERLGVVRLAGGELVTRSVELVGLDLPELTSAEVIEFGTDEHFDLFRVGASRFVTALRQSGRVKRLVLLDCPFTARVGRADRRRLRREEEADGTASPTRMAWLADYAQTTNTAYRRYVRFVRDALGVSTIHVPSRKVALDPQHRWGLAPYHYAPGTYRAIVRGLTRAIADPESRLLPLPRATGGRVTWVGERGEVLPDATRITAPAHPDPAWVGSASAQLAQGMYAEGVPLAQVMVGGSRESTAAALALGASIGCGSIVLDRPTGGAAPHVESTRRAGCLPTLAVIRDHVSRPAARDDVAAALATVAESIGPRGTVVLPVPTGDRDGQALVLHLMSQWQNGEGELWQRAWEGHPPVPSAAQPPPGAPLGYAGPGMPLTATLAWARCPQLVRGKAEVTVELDNPGEPHPQGALLSFAVSDGSREVAEALGAHVSPADQVGTWRYLTVEHGRSRHDLTVTLPPGVLLRGVGVRGWGLVGLVLRGLQLRVSSQDAGRDPSDVDAEAAWGDAGVAGVAGVAGEASGKAKLGDRGVSRTAHTVSGDMR